jgi:hypothetical protein
VGHPDEVVFNEGSLRIQLRPPVPTETMLANMQSAVARGLRELRPCVRHGGLLAIAGGGPSLADTWDRLEGHVAACNGSLGYLLERGVVPHFCGVMDANAHMADIVAADPRVHYLVASNCDPSLLDKLIGAGCDVRLWHPTPDNIGASLSDVRAVIGDRLMIGGGTSIVLRLVQVGYVLGYRKFHLHGSDASFRGTQTHAYWDRRWGKWAEGSSIEVNGYPTSLNYIQHVTSFANMLGRMQAPPFEPVEIEMFGDGLMQACYRCWLAHRHEMSPAEAFERASNRATE